MPLSLAFTNLRLTSPLDATMACSHYWDLIVYSGDGNHRSPISADRTLSATAAWQRQSVESASVECDSLCCRAWLQVAWVSHALWPVAYDLRSEEHTSELQSPDHLVCRLLLEK